MIEHAAKRSAEIAFVDSLTQHCSNAIANALELLPSCTKPPTCASQYPIVLCGDITVKPINNDNLYNAS